MRLATTYRSAMIRRTQSAAIPSTSSHLCPARWSHSSSLDLVHFRIPPQTVGGRKVFPRSLKRTRVSESEYLFGVNDLTRQGAIRFMVDGKPAAGDEGVPVLSKLPELLDTADAVEQNREVSDVSLRRLYRATGSLGGARPKASVRIVMRCGWPNFRNRTAMIGMLSAGKPSPWKSRTWPASKCPNIASLQ